MLSQDRLLWLMQLIDEDKLIKFYQWSEWRKLRQKALKRDNSECQLCKAAGKYHAAENVHHIKEVKTHPELAMTLDNLQCLCIKCHNDVHERHSILSEHKKKEPLFTNEERW